MQTVAYGKPTFICINTQDQRARGYRVKPLESLNQIPMKSSSTQTFMTGRPHIHAQVGKRLCRRVRTIGITFWRHKIIAIFILRLLQRLVFKSANQRETTLPNPTSSPPTTAQAPIPPPQHTPNVVCPRESLIQTGPATRSRLSTRTINVSSSPLRDPRSSLRAASSAMLAVTSAERAAICGCRAILAWRERRRSRIRSTAIMRTTTQMQLTRVVANKP